MPSLLVREVDILNHSLAFERALQFYVLSQDVQNIFLVVSENYLGSLSVLGDRKACNSGTTTKLHYCLIFEFAGVH